MGISNIISRAFGKFASKEFPKPIQNFINFSYTKLLGLDMSRFNSPSSYSSLQKLFTRELKEMPTIDGSSKSVISPCDSKVIALGKIRDDKALQIKGQEYSVKELIDAQDSLAEVLEGGEFINFYLSPKDYHRYHMPFDAKVLSLKYISGALYSVSTSLLKIKESLYNKNERVVLEVLDNFNHKHFIILVGALNVGKMVVDFEPRVKTNAKEGDAFYSYKEPISLKKGELFGWFEMGSTIVILSERESIKYNVEVNQDVKFSDIIGELNDN